MLRASCVCTFWGLLVFTFACTPAQSPDRTSMFRIAVTSDIQSLDPAMAYDEVSWTVIPSIFETLYQYAYLSDPYQVEPLLASDLPTYSTDHLTLTIPIRTGVRFHNDAAFADSGGKGREVSASDVVYSFKRLADPQTNSPAWWALEGKIIGLDSFREKLKSATKAERAKLFATDVDGLHAVDAKTVRIQLYKPFPALLHYLTVPFTSIVAKEWVNQYADRTGKVHVQHPDRAIGTGPFVLKDRIRGQIVELARNPDYRTEFYPITGHQKFVNAGLLKDAGKRLPFLERVDVQVNADLSSQVQLFQRGSLDLLLPTGAHSVPLEDFDLPPGTSKAFFHNDSVQFITFNLSDPILEKNIWLRRALAASVDRVAFLETFYGKNAEIPSGPIPPGLQDRPITIPALGDPSATEMLKRAGHAGGSGLPSLRLDIKGDTVRDQKMAQFLKAEFEKIGVRVTVIHNSLPATLEKLKTGNFQLLLQTWVLDVPDATNIFELLYGGNFPPGPNGARFRHPEFDRYFEFAKKMNPGAPRSDLLRKMTDIVKEQTPWILLAYPTQAVWTQPWVGNFRAGSLGAMIRSPFKYFKNTGRLPNGEANSHAKN